ncbi:MAG: DNA replication protein DnaC, partial [Lachnospiraceae bacterium]|nr:DNA replication protein DnaC [Lachnospiraceae bacterium]
MSLTNAQYDMILHQYEMKQFKSRRDAEQRLAYVYDHIPAYRELEEAVASVSVSQGKKLLNGDPDAMEDLRDSLAELSGRKAQLLEDAGLAPDYLEPVYECPDCKDTGYADGQKCHCFKQAMITLLYEQSNIREMLRTENFDSLSYEYYGGEDLSRFRNAVNTCRNFIKNFNSDYHNLFFYGTVGTGKSFLSGCVAKELIESGHSVIYFSATGLFDLLSKNSFDYKNRDEL